MANPIPNSINNTCSLEDVDLARQQIEYTPLHYTLLFRFSCGFIGAILTFDVLRRIRAIFVFHKNAQIILLSDIFSCLLVDIGFAVSQGVSFLLLRFGDPHNPCGSAISTWFCLIFRSIPQTGMNFTFGCNALFAGERIVAYMYKKRYEYVTPVYSIIGVTLYGAPCLYAFVRTVLVTKLDKTVNVCWEVYGPPPNWILVSWQISDVLAGIIITYLYIKNRNESKKVSDLSTRFHLKASMDITQLLLPLIVIHFVFNIVSSAAVLYVQVNKNNMTSMQYRTLTLAGNLTALKIVFLPGFLCFLFRKVARQRNQRLQTILDRSREEQDYFMAYRKAWGVAEKAMASKHTYTQAVERTLSNTN